MYVLVGSVLISMVWNEERFAIARSLSALGLLSACWLWLIATAMHASEAHEALFVYGLLLVMLHAVFAGWTMGRVGAA